MIYFEVVALSFFVLAVLIIAFILVYLKIINVQGSKHRKWKNIAEILVRDAIFNEEADPGLVHFPIHHRTTVLLKNKRFRNLLTQEILSAKKNMSGTAALFLQRLYLQLKLDEFALEDLSSKKWYIKAKALQDLGIMNLKNYLSKIYRQTNHRNELVRMEAQIAVIKLTGFEGLRFLDVVSYQINDWQQIKLLNELSYLPASNFNGIENWLLSNNESVVIFALKLVKNFHRFELHEQVVDCLACSSDRVRYQAITALEKIYNESTSAILLERYDQEVLKNRIAIAKALQQIGSEEDLPVLVSFIAQEEPEQKRTLVRTIANISPNGLVQLRLLPESNVAPLSLIIKQIEGELLT
ncbi:HEAT repeat domain-containing protein [Pedobacter insulae]|uniref:HEAT repeat-containing protein n=1 Tax=Pedobacter insulae TaxID=414048 RepID=A0A1I2URP7_9SPHI|nr:HEAT repeat domain-containing protein [Pedobacter insulae]SFG78417.1 hypothetical protein SAMN04489864_102249 [Pedobacter insulae]